MKSERRQYSSPAFLYFAKSAKRSGILTDPRLLQSASTLSMLFPHATALNIWHRFSWSAYTSSTIYFQARLCFQVPILPFVFPSTFMFYNPSSSIDLSSRLHVLRYLFYNWSFQSPLCSPIPLIFPVTFMLSLFYLWGVRHFLQYLFYHWSFQVGYNFPVLSFWHLIHTVGQVGYNFPVLSFWHILTVNMTYYIKYLSSS